VRRCVAVVTAVESVLLLGASDLAIAGISAGAALLGALVGGAVTWVVEKSRQSHEEATREQQERELVHGLARIASEELLNERHVMEVESEEMKWYPLRQRKELGIAERQALFRRLTEEEFGALTAAFTAIELIAHLRQGTSPGDPVGDKASGILKRALTLVEDARTKLERVASDSYGA
jgi:hypothetical protein